MGLQNTGTSKRAAVCESDDGIDIDAIDAAMAEIRSTRQQKPKGFTTEEYAKKRNIAHRTAQHHLALLYKEDRADRAIWNDCGRKTYVYSLKG